MSFAEDHEAWAAARLAALKAEDGWLHLTDRVEIAPGRHQVGRGEDAGIRISAGPDRLGILTLGADGAAALDAGAGPLAFVPGPEAPPQLKVGGLLLEISTLEGQAALRVRDLTDPTREAFAGIPSYPPDPTWRILAAWEKLPEAETLRIGTVTGVETSARITHRARFLHEGREIALLPTHWKKGKPMFVIRDATSGPETYAASRFLIGEPQGDRIVLDFNRAFNPPCAFTDFAVCPLPPRENILPFPIPAGEKKPD